MNHAPPIQTTAAATAASSKILRYYCRLKPMLFLHWQLTRSEGRWNSSKKYQFQVHKKYELKRIKILRFTSRAFAGGCCCCCSHAGQPGAVLQHAIQQHRQSRNLSPKKCQHFPTETPKTGHHRLRKDFENAIPQLSYLPIEVVVEIWNFGGVELVGGVSSVGNCWARWKQQRQQQQQQRRRHSCENGALSLHHCEPAARHGS